MTLIDTLMKVFLRGEAGKGCSGAGLRLHRGGSSSEAVRDGNTRQRAVIREAGSVAGASLPEIQDPRIWKGWESMKSTALRMVCWRELFKIFEKEK
ncbi:MAG: hypothetical protein ACLUGJ_11540 [Blautia wexlerae]